MTLAFDFIECFTTTFLHTHSWLNWVDEDDDEDEVGLKEKPEDTRYIKKITSKIPIYCHHWNCGLGNVQARPSLRVPTGV